MILAPGSLEDLVAALRANQSRRERISEVNLAALNSIREYTPEDMTVTVEAGASLEELQRRLGKNGQWLPVDPPFPESTSIGKLLELDLNGPRRYGYGTIREYLIGLEVALADGRLIKSGGKVVKNVAGYDLQKLFVGSRGTLGAVTSATFKVRPLPEEERFMAAPVDSVAAAKQWFERLFDLGIEPVVLDWHRLEAGPAGSTVVLAFAGAKEDVEWQSGQVHDRVEPADPGYDRRFWETGPEARRWSVAPSATAEVIEKAGSLPFLARAGNGVVYVRGGPEPPKAAVPGDLMRRLKNELDPHGIFPEYQW